jgi:U3 small nucleolar RNA-associated protein 19
MPACSPATLGGPLGLLALNGLFILITQYNLCVMLDALSSQYITAMQLTPPHQCLSDYPDFYTKLYSMVDRAVLHVKYRARFFRLTETFLSSSCVLFDSSRALKALG